MESNAGNRSLRTLTIVGVVVALGVVAVASGGSISAGESGGGWRPLDTLLNVAFTLYVVLLVVGALFLLYLLLVLRGLKERPSGRMTPLNMLVVLLVVLACLAFVRRPLGLGESSGIDDPLPPQRTLPEPTLAPESTGDPTGFSWPTALVVAGLLVAAAVAYWWGSARRSRGLSPRERAPLAEALVDVLEVSLDDVRAQRDPRRAVIAAYARLERVLAASGLARRPSDAPLEYLRRVLDDLTVSPEAVRRLTLLFEQARFSHHEVGPDMKDEAISALERVQDELRVADGLAEQERERPAHAAFERARAGR